MPKIKLLNVFVVFVVIYEALARGRTNHFHINLPAIYVLTLIYVSVDKMNQHAEYLGQVIYFRSHCPDAQKTPDQLLHLD